MTAMPYKSMTRVLILVWFGGQRTGLPTIRPQMLDRFEAALVGHLCALGDPVAEIQMVELSFAGAFEKPQYAECAKTALVFIRIEIAVNSRIAMAENVGEASPHQAAIGIADRDEFGLDDRVLDHGAEIRKRHGCHLAPAVTRVLIAGEQFEMFFGRSGDCGRDLQVGVLVPHPSL